MKTHNAERNFIRRIIARLKGSPDDAGLNGNEKAEPGPDQFGETFRFTAGDLAFLSKVARSLEPLAARPDLAPEGASAIERSVAALRRLPEPIREIDVHIEVAHRMGDEDFSESYSYQINLDRRRIEITSSGSQYDPSVGANSFNLESHRWYANGQAVHEGNRDTWLERLAYALARHHTLNVTDESGGQRAETV